MKKNLYEAVLQAITEIDTDNATLEDFLRMGISAEQSAIVLYNKIADSIEKNYGYIPTAQLFRHTSEEEKEHVGEFQRMLLEVDFEEAEAQAEGAEEAEEIIFDSHGDDLLFIEQEVAIAQNNYTLILEKGDKIQIVKKR